MLDKSIRDQFPLLQRKINNTTIVYLDNACMSLRPTKVIETITKYYTEYSACAGRSNHRLAQEVATKMDEARQKVKKFINAKNKNEIIFTRNASEGLNLVAKSLELKPGDEVLTTDKEHNSNLVPWLTLEKTKGIKHQVILSNSDNTFSMDNLKKLLTNKVKVVSIVQTSNLDGVTNPIKEITKLAPY